MPRGLCKCGGRYRKIDEAPPEGYQTVTACLECGHKVYKRPRGSVRKREKKYNLSPLEIGRGIATYLLELEHKCLTLQKQVTELQPLADERDELKKQIGEMQQKYNEAHMNGSVSIPSKMF